MIKSKLELIKTKKANIGIIGLGYVGLPLLMRFVEEGFCTIGFDTDPAKIESLNKKISYINTIDKIKLEILNQKKNLFTSDFSLISELDAIIICVPTPLSKNRDPDLSFITKTLNSILPFLKEGQIVSLESTTYPGTTEEVIVPAIKNIDFRPGENFFIIYSPEREDPGNTKYTTKTIPKICGGHSKNCLEIGTILYGQVVDKVIPVSSLKTAELTKLLENVYRAVNIGLVNELKKVADKMDIDIHEVIEAAATKPFGYVPYYPGPGLGGHCIPIDPFYLTWKAREFGIHTRFIELAGEINSSMPDYVIEKTLYSLNLRGKSIKNSRILLLGIAYKKNVDDLRESPGLVILNKLLELEGVIDYYDPYIKKIPKLRDYLFDFKSVKINKNTIGLYDCVIIVTDHDCFNYDMIQKHSSVLIDTRGVYKKKYKNVVRA